MKSFSKVLAKAADREVIAWSRKEHGWSGWTTSVHSHRYMHDETELMAEIRGALGVERGYWLGHSDGGSIALTTASRFPRSAAGLILEAPYVFAKTSRSPVPPVPPVLSKYRISPSGCATIKPRRQDHYATLAQLESIGASVVDATRVELH